MATVVLPGDNVRTLPSTVQARLGPGVQQVMQPNRGQEDSPKTKVASIRAGLLGSQAQTAKDGTASESIWVESRMKRVSLAPWYPEIRDTSWLGLDQQKARTQS